MIKKRKAKDVKKHKQNPSSKGYLKKVRTLAKNLCEGEGLKLVFLEYLSEFGQMVLRLYIENPKKGIGITLDDCANVSRQFADLVTVECQDFGPYTLEVSSPGSERPLGELQDFIRFDGRKVRVTLVDALNDKKIFCGKIMGVDGCDIKLLVDGETVILKHEKVAQARLVERNGDS